MAAELIWGTAGKPTPYPVTAEARAALAAQGVEAPEELTLYLRTATGRERKTFQGRVASCRTTDDQRELVADLLLGRMAEGSDRRVIREALEDADEVTLNQLMYAYVNGVIPDPKALEKAVDGALARTTPRMLAALAVS
ncbi:hypothetical protein [Deinococcus gobiensis]|uniref:Uncharacterized protein n=1 Tax=Deinococcus gobiensis (strain DSM 21396 / JCM 16679 / CGMCC 1.7299 / I-0) TaxID=745776 RepID=H8GX97_DEIGI|nr:hypothetical protein [Deinococcus gobiensis]AFD25826.1 hypothetical protein DGo_CA1899 [Deinococcus gobiensis I-0]